MNKDTTTLALYTRYSSVLNFMSCDIVFEVSSLHNSALQEMTHTRPLLTYSSDCWRVGNFLFPPISMLPRLGTTNIHHIGYVIQIGFKIPKAIKVLISAQSSVSDRLFTNKSGRRNNDQILAPFWACQGLYLQ